jgi:hypothetical protein
VEPRVGKDGIKLGVQGNGKFIAWWRWPLPIGGADDRHSAQLVKRRGLRSESGDLSGSSHLNNSIHPGQSWAEDWKGRSSQSLEDSVFQVKEFGFAFCSQCSP